MPLSDMSIIKQATLLTNSAAHTNDVDFNFGFGRARWILEYNSVRSAVITLGVFDHQQSLVVGRLQAYDTCNLANDVFY